jgi:hypothetical protein
LKNSYVLFIKNSAKLADGFTEPHPLWEYPAYPLSDIYEIYSVDVTEPIEKEANCIKNTIKLNCQGNLNAIVIWHELIFDDGVINTGIVEKPVAKQHIKWSMQYKQGVHLFDRKYKIDENNNEAINVGYKINCDLKNGIFDCRFNVQELNVEV